MFKNKQKWTSDRSTSGITEINFQGYTREWDDELDSIRISSRKTRRNLPPYPSSLDKTDFESIVKSEYTKMANDEIYFENNEAFTNSIKNQIFAETYRLLGNDVSSISHEEYPQLDEKYSTGIASEDQMIQVAAAGDEELLKLFENKKEQSYEEYQQYNEVHRSDEFHAFKGRREKTLNKYDGTLSEQDKAKIKSYSMYAENLNESLSNPDFQDSKERQEWRSYRDDIANYSEARALEELPTYKLHEEFIKKNAAHVNGTKEVKPDHEIQSIIDNTDKLLKTNDTTRPSIKEQAPFVSHEQRVANVKNLEDTDWEKIKDYVRDFNTNSSSVAIANIPVIVDADNALKVDLNAKFYLSQQELSQLRDKQAKDFKAVIEDYEETLKKHEDKALQKIYDSINDKPAVTVDKSEALKKQEAQKESNLKVIDENIKLKKQIKELEEKLNKPAPVPQVKPKMAKFEMEALIVEVNPSAPVVNENTDKAQPQKANIIQPQRKPAIAGKIQLKSLQANNGSQGIPKKSAFMSMNNPASAMNQRNQPTSPLQVGSPKSQNLISNTLAANRQSAMGSSFHGQENLDSPMDQPMKINLNQVKKQANEDTHFVGPEDEINKIVSLKDAIAKNKK